MRKIVKKKNKCKSITLFFIFGILVIIYIINMSVSFAKYQSRLFGIDSVKVALLAHDVSVSIPVSQSLYPGSDPVIVPIVITNKENGKICEVSENYVIKLANDFSNLPLEYKLCKDSNCSLQIFKNENDYYADSSFSFSAGVESCITYYLYVYWPEELNDSSYAFEIDYIKFDFIITQVD